MSRIAEALRRAAAQPTDETEVDGVNARTAAGLDAASLPQEPFPHELGEAQRQPANAPQADDRTQTTLSLTPAEAETEATHRDEQTRAHRSKILERIDARLAEKVVLDERMSPISREQYRRLAAILHDAQTTSGLRTIMLASAAPGEGKSLTATNLALTLSESYRDKVLLIDADLRKPTLHQIFGLVASSGLVDGLNGKPDRKILVRQVTERLSVLPAGRPTSDPMAALTSQRMRQLVDEARGSYDWIILDTPPLILLPDAHLLSDMVDGTILVIKANATAYEHVRRTADIIGRERLIGVVLNQAEARVQSAYGYGYYHSYLSNDDRGR